MLDLVVLMIVLVFIAGSLGLIWVCGRLMEA
jgi:hypothetical protein